MVLKDVLVMNKVLFLFKWDVEGKLLDVFDYVIMGMNFLLFVMYVKIMLLLIWIFVFFFGIIINFKWGIIVIFRIMMILLKMFLVRYV